MEQMKLQKIKIQHAVAERVNGKLEIKAGIITDMTLEDIRG